MSGEYTPLADITQGQNSYNRSYKTDEQLQELAELISGLQKNNESGRRKAGKSSTADWLNLVY